MISLMPAKIESSMEGYSKESRVEFLWLEIRRESAAKSFRLRFRLIGDYYLSLSYALLGFLGSYPSLLVTGLLDLGYCRIGLKIV